MSEQNIFYEIFKYGSYVVLALFGWFFRRHVEKSDMREQAQDKKLELLDKRLDGHDVSRADMKAQIIAIHQILLRMDKNIDKLLDK